LENGVFAIVQEYFTKEESVYEAHKKYIDLQYIVSGEEIIYVSDISEVQECVESYDETKDIAFYQTAQSCRKVKLEKDTFVILFPNDAHKPCISVCGNPSEVRKVVVKIPVK
jgi:YhcH/YjgK/YiaL family protein